MTKDSSKRHRAASRKRRRIEDRSAGFIPQCQDIPVIEVTPKSVSSDRAAA